jgi:hypothetical protein
VASAGKACPFSGLMDAQDARQAMVPTQAEHAKQLYIFKQKLQRLLQRRHRSREIKSAASGAAAGSGLSLRQQSSALSLSRQTPAH